MAEKTNIVMSTDKKPLWIACRGTPGCEGKQAVAVFTRRSENISDYGGQTTRYRCLTCGKPFHITR